MILKAICDYEDPRLFELFRSRYNQEDFFLSYYRGATMKHYYDGRVTTGRFYQMKAARRPDDENGLFGFQEVSHYWNH